ncbi:DEAD/DEAH box helicase [Bdellovibrionota bacterium FG-1]
MSPTAHSSSEKMNHGFCLPSESKLRVYTLLKLKAAFFDRDSFPLAEEILCDLESKQGVQAKRLTTGELDLSFTYDGISDDDYTPLKPAHVRIQESKPSEDFVARCDCQNGRQDRLCGHLMASLILLWRLLNRDYKGIKHPPLEEYLAEKVEPQLDVLLGRTHRPNPNAGISLAAVVFCLSDASEPLKPKEASISGSIPPMRSGDLHSLIQRARLPLTSSTLSPDDFPATLRSQLEHPEYSYWNNPQTLLREHLQYQFSDGTTLTALELLRHRFLKKVPKDLLPLRETSEAPIPGWAHLILPEALSARYWYDKDMERAFIGLLARALKTKSKSANAPRVAFTSSVLREQKRSTLEIQAIEFDAPPAEGSKSHWQLIPSPESRPNEAQLKFSGDSQHCWTIDGSTLRFLPGPATASARPKSSTHIIANQEQITDEVQALNNFLTARDLPGVTLPEPLRLNATDPSVVRPEIRLDSTDTFRFALFLPAFNTRVWNPNPEARSWIYLLKDGIGAAAPVDKSELAHNHRGSKRDADLKLLRHCGFASCLFLETASYALEGKSSSGQEFANPKDFKAWLKTRLTTLALEIIDKTEPLETVYSHRVVEFIWLLAQQIQDSLTKPRAWHCLVAGNWLTLEQGSLPIARFILQLLRGAALRTGGLCFTKARTPAAFQGTTQFTPILVAPADSSENSEDLLISKFGIEEPFKVCLPLLAHGYDLYWKGKPLGLLNADDLKTVFDLTGSKSLDWFELNPKVFLMGKQISRDAFSEIARTGMMEFQGQLYLIPAANLPSMKRLSKFWERLGGNGNALGNFNEESGGYHRLPKSQALEFLALEKELGAEVLGENAEWKAVREFYHSLDLPRPPLEVPKTILAELKPYQKLGVQWLLDLHRLRLGGILADDMGLGKTLQALAFLEILRIQNRLGPSLIIVPTSLTWNWKSEAERFTPSLPIRVFDPKAKTAIEQDLAAGTLKLLVVTYGLLLEHQEWFEKQTSGDPRRWDVVLLDEAQNIKNIRAKRTEAARSLNAAYKFCMTGTPLENNLGELYSLMDLVVPGSLGELTGFRSKYEGISDPQEAAIEFGFLRLLLRPLMLRRTKSQVLMELPPKTESRVNLPLEAKQRKIYRDVALSWNQQVQASIEQYGEARSQLVMLTALLRLRQVCSDPATVPGVKYPGISPKMDLLAESLQEILEAGESVLVFTQFVGTLERLRTHLTSLGIETLCIHGAISRAERERILRQFQDPQAPAQVLIMTLKTGGVGLNLTRASYVFHLEPWWNPAAENQATDRAHRIGQERPVQVYRYVMQDTVEEKIELLKARKAAVFDAVMVESADGAVEGTPGLRTLSQRDFEVLLSERYQVTS